MMASRAFRLGASFALFQGAWFACVLGAERGHVALGIAVVAAVVAALLASSTHRAADLRLLVLALAVGAVWDSVLARSGIVDYASPGPFPGWAPVWILALWVLFAPMLREPMRWLHGRPALAALLGGVGGPLSYAAAERLGACAFPDRALALVVLGTGWALIVPLLLAAAQRWERGTRQQAVAATSREVRT
jgi:Protein of unknown function (DUF2878)